MSILPLFLLENVRRLFVSLSLVLLASTTLAGEKVMLQDAWLREAQPKMMMHAAYLTVMNPGVETIYLVGADSPQYAKAEIHLSTVTHGVATMARQDQLAIPAGGTLKLKPGSILSI